MVQTQISIMWEKNHHEHMNKLLTSTLNGISSILDIVIKIWIKIGSDQYNF